MSPAVSVTWWGHATTTIELGGRRVLTDPILTRRVAHLSRIGGPPPGAVALRADAAVVSHLHHDHLHAPSLRKLAADVRIIAPKGAAGVLYRSAPAVARRIEEVGAGDVIDLDGVSLTAVPAEHDGRRSPWSRHHGPALGFVMAAEGAGELASVWFAGDTGLFAGMAELDPVAVAVVPIGGWGPTLGPTHLNPEQAAEAVRRVGARDAVPIHYGTFWPTGLRRVHPASFRRLFTEPAAGFADALEVVCPDARAHVISHGETVTIRRSTP
jgi:L-ascorbate metabolism protein UlaG (beta-lactamase superfamily)